MLFFFFFFFNDTATTEIYTLSLHDALPIRPALGAPMYPGTRALRRGRCGAVHGPRLNRTSLDNLVRAQQQRRRDRQAECLGGPQVDVYFVVGRLLDREIPGLRALGDLVDVGGGLNCHLDQVRTE